MCLTIGHLLNDYLHGAESAFPVGEETEAGEPLSLPSMEELFGPDNLEGDTLHDTAVDEQVEPQHAN